MMYDNDRLSKTGRWLHRLAGVVLALAVASSPLLAAGKGPGYVDPTTFIRIAGDDAVQVQVSISEAMLRIVTGSSPELKEIAGGLKSIEAVVLDLSGRGVAENVREALLDAESNLRKKGWERLVLVRDEDGEVRVLVLPAGDRINGLVVLVLDPSDGTMVFANIAGSIDLAKLAEIGESFGVPGLEDVDPDDFD
jgi:hypothetical protein